METLPFFSSPLEKFLKRKYLTYKEWKHSLKRSHCLMSYSKYLTYKEWKRNLTSERACPIAMPCKYLTYKEWKRVRLTILMLSPICKYLTYKEWKRFLLHFSCHINLLATGKYLTYKEWKLVVSGVVVVGSGS